MQKPGPEESFEPRAATKSGHNLRSQTLRLARGVGGQGIAEFVFAIPVFMTLVFGMYEFSRYYSTRLMIRSAVAEGARFATTGNQLVDPVTGDPLPRAVSIVNTILNRTAHFGVTAGDITLDPADGGGPEEIVTVSLNYDYPVAIPLMQSIFGTGVLDFDVATVMRNEPFFE